MNNDDNFFLLKANRRLFWISLQAKIDNIPQQLNQNKFFIRTFIFALFVDFFDERRGKLILLLTLNSLLGGSFFWKEVSFE